VKTIYWFRYTAFVTFSHSRVGLLFTIVFEPLSGGCFDGENGTNDAFAVQSCVADFLPGWAILFITVPDFLYVNEIFFACFRGPFLTVK
jgi:hypothetical protein